jgi:plastocyanin
MTSNAPRRRLRVGVALLTVLLLAGACSSKKDVGSESLLKGTDDKTGDTRLGETTTTAAPENAPTTASTAPPATQPPTTQAAAPAVEVSINSDTTSGGQFQPRVAQVPAGATVRFVNKDSVARSVVSDAGVFDSGPIAPGATWDWVAQGAGDYNYSDGTRPYAVGTIQVR